MSDEKRIMLETNVYINGQKFSTMRQLYREGDSGGFMNKFIYTNSLDEPTEVVYKTEHSQKVLAPQAHSKDAKSLGTVEE